MDVPITCPCPLKGGAIRHPEGDTVMLRERLSFHDALAIRKASALAKDGLENPSERELAAEILATMSEFYVLMGVEAWTLVDSQDQPLPVLRSTIRSVLLDSPDIDLIVEAADSMYNPVVLLPLLHRANPSSPTTPTRSPEHEPSTSATESPTTPQKPSKPSSITTSQTDATVTTSLSLVGDSNSSQNSQSAA